MAAYANHGDDPVLERLTQRLEHGARELRQLVEQQDATMRQCSGMSLEGCASLVSSA